MTPEEDALRRVIDVVVRLGIPYMLTGSVASSYYGRPRATHDADLVIDPAAPQLAALVQELVDKGFYVDAARARDALQRRSQFNAIDLEHACKIDLIVRRERPFSEEEFRRRQSVNLTFRSDVAMVTAEDAVLSKLEWARRAGESERQLADAAAIVALNPNLDRAYIEHWALALRVVDLWRRVSEHS